MLKWLYLINALISFICLLYYFEITSTKINQKQLFILILTTVSNYAFALSVFADNLEGVYVGLQVYYASNIFVALLFLMVIAELCGYKLPRAVGFSFLGLGLGIILAYSQIKHNGLYYKDFWLVTVHGISAMGRTYGPLHSFLLLYIGLIDCFSIGYVLYAFRKRKDMSKRTIVILLLLLLASSLLYVFPKVAKLKFEIMPFIFCLIDIVVVYLFYRAALYDISSNLLNVYERRSEYGCVAIDVKYRYLGANKFAREIFPYLENIRIDSRMNIEDENIFCKTVLPWLDNWINGQHDELTVTVKSKSVVCAVNEIKNGKHIVGYLIELRDNTQIQHYMDMINTYNGKLQNEVNVKTKQLQDIQDSIISGMATMVESRDNSTGGHIKRTSAGVKLFVERLLASKKYKEITPDFCERLIKAAPMHDLGKIAVDDAILRKPDKFTEDEYEKMKVHAVEGARIVNEVLRNVDDKQFKTIATNVAYYHHEHWDGEGYPNNLYREKIPLEARIMAFADVFDALVSNRCYKKAMSFDQAFSIIEQDLGTQFDPELGDFFLECRQELEALYTSLDE